MPRGIWGVAPRAADTLYMGLLFPMAIPGERRSRALEAKGFRVRCAGETAQFDLFLIYACHNLFRSRYGFNAWRLDP